MTPISKKKPPLWSYLIRGRQITPENLLTDARAVAGTVLEDPSAAVETLRKKLRGYIDRGGPDINQPVPLTANRYARRRP